MSPVQSVCNVTIICAVHVKFNVTFAECDVMLYMHYLWTEMSRNVCTVSGLKCHIYPCTTCTMKCHDYEYSACGFGCDPCM